MRNSHWSAVLLCLCLALGSAAANPAAAQPAPGPAAPAPQFGPRLFLAGVPPARRGVLDGLALALHARLANPTPDDGAAGPSRYLASGDDAARDQAAAAGLDVQTLDLDTTGQVYYLVDSAPLGAEATRAALAGVGRVVYTDAAQAVLALPAAVEAPGLEVLLAQRLRISRLDADRLILEESAPVAPPRAAQALPDPYVASLLPLVTTTALSAYMADLSGVHPVTIGTRSVTLTTRYYLAGHTADVEAYVYQYFAGLGLPTSYVNWTYGNYSGHNVIADIPGTVHPERLWLIGGHFDSNSNNPYVLAPGADDNGSGMAATMLIAAILRDKQFSDTIRFVNFGAEEFGEWGSKVYAAALRAAGAQVMGYIDLDMIGYDGNGDRTIELHTGTGAASVSLGTALSSANTRYSQGLRVEIKQASASNFSDHSSFWTRSYPAVLAIENFYADSIPADHNPWYHNTGDLLTRVDLDYVARYTRTALATIAELAGIAPAPPNASFKEQSVAASMYAGFSYTATVTFQNTGWQTWTEAAAFRLGTHEPQETTTWGRNRALLPPDQSVTPGATWRFDFYVQAPADPGNYPWQWQMVQEGVTWFGDPAPALTIEVLARPVLELQLYLPEMTQ